MGTHEFVEVFLPHILWLVSLVVEVHLRGVPRSVFKGQAPAKTKSIINNLCWNAEGPVSHSLRHFIIIFLILNKLNYASAENGTFTPKCDFWARTGPRHSRSTRRRAPKSPPTLYYSNLPLNTIISYKNYIYYYYITSEL